MIGGTVVETIELADRIWINCRERYSRECAIYVEKDSKSRCVSEGDTVWWQSGSAYWTPKFYVQKSGKECKHFDIKLKRIGFSGVKRPALVETIGPHEK